MATKNSKRTAKPSYYAVQIDDVGSRRVAAGHRTARSVAQHIASLATWINVDEFASSWNAAAPDGGERFEIGQE